MSHKCGHKAASAFVYLTCLLGGLRQHHVLGCVGRAVAQKLEQGSSQMRNERASGMLHVRSQVSASTTKPLSLRLTMA